MGLPRFDWKVGSVAHLFVAHSKRLISQIKAKTSQRSEHLKVFCGSFLNSFLWVAFSWVEFHQFFKKKSHILLHSHQFWRFWRKLRQDERGRRGWWHPPSPSCRTAWCLCWWTGSGTPWDRAQRLVQRRGNREGSEVTENKWWKQYERRETSSTHGVSSMTRHTQAMVLRQSVVSSMGSVLFWRNTNWMSWNVPLTRWRQSASV